MNQITQYVAELVVEGIIKIAQCNLSSASTILGYQPQAPKALVSELEEDVK